MKKIFANIGLAGLAAGVFTGCALFTTPVPQTTVKGTIAGQPFSITSPKNITIKNLSASVDTNGVANLKIGFLQSENDSNVVSAAYSGQASIVKETGDAVLNAVNAGAVLAGNTAAAAK